MKNFSSKINIQWINQLYSGLIRPLAIISFKTIMTYYYQSGLWKHIIDRARS